MPEYTLVISDTSPLFYLEQLDQIELLPKLYGEIIVPHAVVDELSAGAQLGERVPNLAQLSWITVRSVNVPNSLRSITDLGKGEAEAIALGLEITNSLLLLDDRLGRQVAIQNGLTVTGTIGVLLRAKQKGLIPLLAPALSELKRARFRISDQVIRDALELAGETS
ncbi:MAG: hypothetical protein HDKAJFGB_04210 [Anaerolineae bacterium]|nr:hypothetical protein [Anaerolineae bacterium]